MWEYVFWYILDISSVSTYEYVSLIALFNSVGESDTIDPRLLDRGFTDEQIQALRDQVDKQRKGNSLSSLNVHITGDLKRFKLDTFDYILSLYHIYNKTGNLPYPGSISEQPNKIMEIINIIDMLSMEKQETDRKRIEKENKRNV